MVWVDDVSSSVTRQSTCATVPSSTGEPLGPIRYATPSNRERGSPPAKRSASARCSSARMFTQNRCEAAMSGCAVATRFTQISTVGGSADTLANAFTVKPWMRSSSDVVTMATPVTKRRIAARKSSVDAGTDPDPVADRHDGRVEPRIAEEFLVERAQRFGVRFVRRLGNRGGATGPQQVVDDDDPGALEHRHDRVEVVLVLGLDRVDEHDVEVALGERAEHFERGLVDDLDPLLDAGAPEVRRRDLGSLHVGIDRPDAPGGRQRDRKSTRLNSSH